MTRKQSNKPFFLGAVIGSSLVVLALKMRKAGSFKRFEKAVGDFVRGSQKTIERVAGGKRAKRK